MSYTIYKTYLQPKDNKQHATLKNVTDYSRIAASEVIAFENNKQEALQHITSKDFNNFMKSKTKDSTKTTKKLLHNLWYNLLDVTTEKIVHLEIKNFIYLDNNQIEAITIIKE